MKAKVYRIEYRLSAFAQYSTDLEDARLELKKNGYIQKKVLNVAENQAELWERSEDQVFKSSTARILEIPCINEVPDFVYRLKSAMGAVEKMTPEEIERTFNPKGVPLPGVEVENDYNREQIKYIMEDYIVTVCHNHVFVKLKTIQ